jgi:hypothetical protein
MSNLLPSRLLPSDSAVLATAVVDNLVISVDPDAPASGIYYWEIARPWRDAVVAAVLACEDEVVGTLGASVLAVPADPARYQALHAALLDRQGRVRSVDEILHLGWRAECNSRLGHVLGNAYTPGESVSVSTSDLRELPATQGLPAGASPEVLIVIPFRDRTPGGGDRLRNLLACLRALRDQSYRRNNYQVTVVETDDRSRWRDVIAPLADNYMFAPKADSFNRSWAVNVGVQNTPGPNEIICIQDADVLADREFVARNAARFTGPGTMGHHPYRDMLCLDHDSTWLAIRQRLFDRAPDADLDRLRGFTLRRGPGCCVWVRADAFRRVNGMDERYEGWGGEDIDFNYRFGFDAAYDAYHDTLLHMRHPASSALRDDGQLINAHIEPMSWHPDEPIGRSDRFVNA